MPHIATCQLYPSEILYSQGTISNRFDTKSAHSDMTIGEVLDDIVDGRCRIDDIPMISVVRLNYRWVTRDNRRLWIFKQLERLGLCDKIRVRQYSDIPSKKLNSSTDGQTVKVRGGGPGGYWHTQSSVHSSYGVNVYNYSHKERAPSRKRTSNSASVSKESVHQQSYRYYGDDGYDDVDYAYRESFISGGSRYNADNTTKDSSIGIGKLILGSIVLGALYYMFKS